MENKLFKSSNGRLFKNDKIVIVHYSNILKQLEEVEQKIKLIVVDNSDFMTIYIVEVLDDSFLDDPIIVKDLMLCIINWAKWFFYPNSKKRNSLIKCLRLK